MKHFLDKVLTDADRKARAIAKLKLSDAKLLAKLSENASRFDRMRDVLGSLEKMVASASRSAGFSADKQSHELNKDRH